MPSEGLQCLAAPSTGTAVLYAKTARPTTHCGRAPRVLHGLRDFRGKARDRAPRDRIPRRRPPRQGDRRPRRRDALARQGEAGDRRGRSAGERAAAAEGGARREGGPDHPRGARRRERRERRARAPVPAAMPRVRRSPSASSRAPSSWSTSPPASPPRRSAPARRAPSPTRSSRATPSSAGVGYSPREPGLVHRLDTDTSGLVVVARSAAAFEQLKSALKEGRITKRYLLVCDGRGARRRRDDRVPDREPPEGPAPRPRLHPPARRHAQRAAPRLDRVPRAEARTQVGARGRRGLARAAPPESARTSRRSSTRSSGDALYGGPVVEGLGAPRAPRLARRLRRRRRRLAPVRRRVSAPRGARRRWSRGET